MVKRLSGPTNEQRVMRGLASLAIGIIVAVIVVVAAAAADATWPYYLIALIPPILSLFPAWLLSRKPDYLP